MVVLLTVAKCQQRGATSPRYARIGVARSVGWAAGYAATGYAAGAPQEAERATQADLLRDIFGIVT